MFELATVWFAVCSLLITGTATTDGSRCDCNFPTNSPVCGDNDKTYNNQEELECFNECRNESVRIKAKKACRSCDCDANRLLFPVCGSDGRTYENPSVVECRNTCLYSRIASYEEGKCKANDKMLTVFAAQRT